MTWWRKWKRERESMVVPDSEAVRRAIDQRKHIERAERRVREQGEQLPPLMDAFTAEVRRALRGRPA